MIEAIIYTASFIFAIIVLIAVAFFIKWAVDNGYFSEFIHIMFQKGGKLNGKLFRS